jgi:spermidine/putrescine-binding protein
MMQQVRRQVVRMSWYAIVVGVLAVPVAAQQTSTWRCPEGFAGQTLDFYNLGNYIAPQIVQSFSDVCQVNVNYTEYAAPEQLDEVLRAGNSGIDLAVVIDSALYALANDGLLQPLDRSRIPNFANLYGDVLGTPYDPDNTYGAPYQWGAIGTLYTTTDVPVPPTTWAEVLAQPNIAWLNDADIMLSIALRANGADPNSADVVQIAAARDLLLSRAAQVTALSGGNAIDIMLSRQANLVVDYAGNQLQLQLLCNCASYNFVVPNDGGPRWVDHLVIPVGAPEAALAHVFIDFLLDPVVSAALSSSTGYATPNRIAVEQGNIDAMLLENPAVYPPQAVRDALWMLDPDPMRIELRQSAWQQVVAALPAQVLATPTPAP